MSFSNRPSSTMDTASTLTDLLQTLRQAKNLSDAKARLLCEVSSADPINLKLTEFTSTSFSKTIQRRAKAFASIQTSVNHIPSEVLWSHLIPLAELFVKWSESQSPCIIGIAGLPGSGKTTLSRSLAAIIEASSDRSVIAVSLDDFYLTPSEREVRGFRWRAVPGSHDLGMLAEFLISICSNPETIEVPSYDTKAETRLAPLICRRPDVVLLDGWLLGARAPGYEFVEDTLDHIVFVDMDLETAHRSRLAREENIRRESAGKLGMTMEDTELFWHEALLPTAVKCATALKTNADIVLRVDEEYRFVEITGHAFP